MAHHEESEEHDQRHPIRDAMVLERITSPLAFQRLLSLAEEVCLSRPLPPVEVLSDMDEAQQVVAMYGARGLRDAIEITLRGEMTNHAPNASTLADSMTVRYPEATGYEQDSQMLAQIEAFGAALLDESYKTLGVDANEMRDKFMHAQTYEEKDEVFVWLQTRIAKMTKGAIEETEDDDIDPLIYHPARLSPKFVGVYPDIKLPPTCLGVSVIAASFFRAAGAPVMHAGVMRRAYDDDMSSISSMAWYAAEETKRIAGDTALGRSLLQRAEQINEGLKQNDIGYHASTLVRIGEGEWCQFDPNYKETILWDGSQAQARNLDRIYDVLQDFQHVAPNLEIALYSGSTSPLSVYGYHGYYHDETQLHKARNIIESLMTNADPKTVRQQLCDELAHIYFELYNLPAEQPIHEQTLFFDLNEASIKLALEAPENDESEEELPLTPFEGIVMELIDKYIFYGDPIEEVLERCKHDTAYRTRRADDALSILFAVRATGISPIKDVHRMIEVGNAEMRIGFAVLSDFASYFGSDLTTGFWHSNWPSLIPVTERLDDAQTDGEKVLAIRALATAAGRSLTYLREYDKMMTDFAQDALRGGENHEHNQLEEAREAS